MVIIMLTIVTQLAAVSSNATDSCHTTTLAV